MSGALLRRTALVEAGGFDEALLAYEDYDLLLRLAQRSPIAGSAEVLLVRHEHAGPQLSRNYPALAHDAVILDRKWAAAIAGSCGRVGYWSWRAWLVKNAELARVMRAGETGARLDGVRSVGRMARYLPWSAPAMARGIAVTLLGLPAYRRLTARLLAWPAIRARVSG